MLSNLLAVIQPASCSKSEILQPFVIMETETDISTEDLSSHITHLESELENMNNNLSELILQNLNIKKVNKELTVENSYIQNSLYLLELRFGEFCQYSRRENVEFHNIPESISQTKLENYIIDILHSVNINIVSYDIAAVHRIGRKFDGKCRKVIVRFINRKNASCSIKSSKQLKKSKNANYKKYFITENLCPEYRQIFNKLYKLKKRGEINNVWTSYGIIYLKINDSEDEHAVIIKHIEDIDYYMNPSSFSESESEDEY